MEFSTLLFCASSPSRVTADWGNRHILTYPRWSSKRSQALPLHQGSCALDSRIRCVRIYEVHRMLKLSITCYKQAHCTFDSSIDFSRSMRMLAHQSRAKCRLSRPKAGWARLFTTGPIWANRSGKSRPGQKKPARQTENRPGEKKAGPVKKASPARKIPARQIRAGRVWKRAALLVLTSQWANIARSAFPFIRIRLICRRSC